MLHVLFPCHLAQVHATHTSWAATLGWEWSSPSMAGPPLEVICPLLSFSRDGFQLSGVLCCFGLTLVAPWGRPLCILSKPDTLVIQNAHLLSELELLAAARGRFAANSQLSQ